MDTLFSLSLLLKEAVRETDDEKAKEILIFKHLQTIVQEKWTIDDFPKGNVIRNLTWSYKSNKKFFL